MDVEAALLKLVHFVGLAEELNRQAKVVGGDKAVVRKGEISDAKTAIRTLSKAVLNDRARVERALRGDD